MPVDPLQRARARLMLFNFERIVRARSYFGKRKNNASAKFSDKARAEIRDRLTQLAPLFVKNKYMLRRRVLYARRGSSAIVVASRSPAALICRRQRHLC